MRSLAKTGLKIGVNWYLFPDERHNSDGKYTEYLADDEYLVARCDYELYLYLKTTLGYASDELSVEMIESSGLLPDIQFYHKIKKQILKSVDSMTSNDWGKHFRIGETDI